MMKDPLVYADHILRSVSQIEKYIEGYNRETFSKDKMRYDAILRNLQTMAEATQRLPEEIKENYPNIPWKDIAGFRNILVHDYLGDLDEDIIWSIVVHELRPIKEAIKEILS